MKKLASIVLLMLAFASLTYVVSRGISSYQKKGNLQKHASGIVLYEQRCATCHQSNGEGISGLYPPLQSSDYVVENYVDETYYRNFSSLNSIKAKASGSNISLEYFVASL